MRIATAFAIAAAAVGAPATPSPKSLDACLEPAIPSEKVACIARWVGSRPAGEREMDALRRLAPDDPEAVARVASSAAGAARTPALRASLHDLAGQSLARLERHAEAATAFAAAVELDSGATPLAWFAEDGGRRWTTDLDSGDGRLERTARSLLLAGRPAEARAALARALALGATGWAADEGWPRVGGGAIPGLDVAPTELKAETSRPVFPDIAIGLLDGGTFEPASARGKVVLLDFWASWCAPCLQELPHLQKLWAEERSNGLLVVAVNSEESDEVARGTASRLGLTMPIGRYSPGLDKVLRVRTLPALVLLDKQGRMRARWDGYGRGLEREVAAKVRDLLGADVEGAPVPIARALAGGERLGLAWSREFPATISGLAVVPADAGPSRVVAGSGKHVFLLDRTGETVVRQEVPSGAGRLVAAGPLEDGRTLVASFRAGGAEVLLLDPQAGTHRARVSSSPVFDAAFLPASGRPGSSASLAVATADGVHLLAIEAGTSRRLPGAGEFRSVRVALDGRMMALSQAGVLHAYASDGTADGTRPAPDGGEVLVAPPKGIGGWGVSRGWLSASASGRFLRGGASQIALATVAGQLVMVDAATGNEVFRAAWPGISALAVVDVDGDGTDELIVASARRLSLLRAPAPVPPAAS